MGQVLLFVQIQPAYFYFIMEHLFFLKLLLTLNICTCFPFVFWILSLLSQIGVIFYSSKHWGHILKTNSQANYNLLDFLLKESFGK